MRIVVITPPKPIVLPEEIIGWESGDEALSTRYENLIAAVTEEIDGPSGWLGRCLGLQTIEMSKDCWSLRTTDLPCGPVVDIVSVKYLDVAGVEQTIDAANYMHRDDSLYFNAGYTIPTPGCFPAPIRIRYRAGYDEATTGKVPERARQAIILLVQELLNAGAENLFLRAEEVDGIGRREFTVSDQASKVIRSAADRLLSGLRRYI